MEQEQDVFAIVLEKVKPTVADPKPGVAVAIGRKIYLVPRFTAKLMRTHAEALNKIATMTEATDPVEALDTSMPVIVDALKRNYTDITAEALEDAIEIGAPMVELIRAIMGQAGYKPAAVGEK